MGKKTKSDTSKSSEKNMAVNSSASTNAAVKLQNRLIQISYSDMQMKYLNMDLL